MRSPLRILMFIAIGAIPSLTSGCGGVTNENVETHVVTEDELDEARKMTQSMPTPADSQDKDEKSTSRR